MTDFQEWLGKLQKRGSKPHRLKHCLGSRDAFMWVRRNKWKALHGQHCDKLLYSQIITEVNRELVELLFEGHEVEFPYQMGTLLINCVPARYSLIDGEYKSNQKVDWKRTMQYLYEDREALEKHKRIKRITQFVYNVRYYKKRARYHNLRFYSFRPNRSLSRRLGWAQCNKLLAEHTEY